MRLQAGALAPKLTLNLLYPAILLLLRATQAYGSRCPVNRLAPVVDTSRARFRAFGEGGGAVGAKKQRIGMRRQATAHDPS